MNILCKGLSFVPLPKYNTFKWTTDINLFVRKLKWKKFFSIQARKEAAELGIPPDMLQDVRLLYDIADTIPDSGQGPMTTLRGRNTKMPPLGDISVPDVFLDAVTRDLEQLRVHSTNNCTPTDLKALASLEGDDQIVIKPSDKGGNIVIMDRTQYIQMCNDLLSNTTCYEVLAQNPTLTYQTELRSILQEAKTTKLISANEFDYLYPRSPKTATFYSLPKLHKGTTPLKGRPIVSGIDNLTQNAGQYIDQILRPFVEALPSYTKDTTGTSYAV